MTEPKPPTRRPPARDAEIDYLVCRQCNTPCYVFEMEEGSIAEAQCLVCGNDDTKTFNLGEDAGGEDSEGEEN